jgi:hypothetical protein
VAHAILNVEHTNFFTCVFYKKEYFNKWMVQLQRRNKNANKEGDL